MRPWVAVARGPISCAQWGSTALMYAAQNGHADCAQLLLNAGADKDAKNKVRGLIAASMGEWMIVFAEIFLRHFWLISSLQCCGTIFV